MFFFQILGQGLCCAERNKDRFLQRPEVLQVKISLQLELELKISEAQFIN
jgi:hypothetical protein